MEIGGYDVIIKHQLSEKECLDRIRPAILAHWPNMVIEIADDLGRNEIFWYKDSSGKEMWDKDCGPEDTMIYTIIEKEQLTVVHDGSDAVVATIKHHMG